MGDKIKQAVENADAGSLGGVRACMGLALQQAKHDHGLHSTGVPGTGDRIAASSVAIRSGFRKFSSSAY